MRISNRREFVQSLSFPLLAAPSLGANDRIRVAVVGLKRRGREHISCFHDLATEENVEVAGLCDVDERVLQESAAYYEKLSGRKARLVVDLRKLLDDSSIDAISYSTPNHWHALGTIWACQAGKDVFLEKPAAHTIWRAGR